MKTFVLDSLNRYMKLSDKLDTQTFICNGSWWIYNDTKEKEIWVFQNKGRLLTAVNGIVQVKEWEYVTNNKTILVTQENSSYMFNIAFIDDKVFLLNLDGTQEYILMLNENEISNVKEITLNDITNYLEGNDETNKEDETVEVPQETSIYYAQPVTRNNSKPIGEKGVTVEYEGCLSSILFLIVLIGTSFLWIFSI